MKKEAYTKNNERFGPSMRPARHHLAGTSLTVAATPVPGGRGRRGDPGWNHKGSPARAYSRSFNLAYSKYFFSSVQNTCRTRRKTLSDCSCGVPSDCPRAQEEKAGDKIAGRQARKRGRPRVRKCHPRTASSQKRKLPPAPTGGGQPTRGALHSTHEERAAFHAPQQQKLSRWVSLPEAVCQRQRRSTRRSNARTCSLARCHLPPLMAGPPPHEECLPRPVGSRRLIFDKTTAPCLQPAHSALKRVVRNLHNTTKPRELYEGLPANVLWCKPQVGRAERPSMLWSVMETLLVQGPRLPVRLQHVERPLHLVPGKRAAPRLPGSGLGQGPPTCSPTARASACSPGPSDPGSGQQQQQRKFSRWASLPAPEAVDAAIRPRQLLRLSRRCRPCLTAAASLPAPKAVDVAIPRTCYACQGVVAPARAAAALVAIVRGTRWQSRTGNSKRVTRNQSKVLH
eukprot:g56704.t1